MFKVLTIVTRAVGYLTSIASNLEDVNRNGALLHNIEDNYYVHKFGISRVPDRAKRGNPAGLQAVHDLACQCRVADHEDRFSLRFNVQPV